MPFADKERDKAWKREYYRQNKDSILAKQHEYYRAHRDEIIAQRAPKNAENRRRHSLKWKTAFLDMYGHECACCGEIIFEFLTLEHLQGRSGPDGHMLGAQSYKNAVKEYRPDLYQVLCMNCNFAKGRYGVCPHQNRKQGTLEVLMTSASA